MAEESAALALLEHCVQISSGSQDPQGIRAVQEVVAGRMRALGAQLEWIAPERGGAIEPPHGAELLVAQWGEGPFVTLVTHADTVFEKGSGFSGLAWNADRTWVTGPGVIDDKGGIVVAWLGLKRYFTSLAGAPPKGLRFLCAPTEELGSPGFAKIFQKLSRESRLVLGFEPSLDDGALITSRQGNRWYKITVHGKSAHAGRDHRKGVNAAHELCIKLDKIQRLTQYPKKITANIGSITAGTGKYNIVCAHAEGRVDVRFPTFAAMKRVDTKIRQVLKSKFVKGASTEFVYMDDCPPLEASAEGRKLAQKVQSIAKRLGQKAPALAASGGSSDCNYLSRPGLAIVDGLGPVGHGLHTTQESLRVDSLVAKGEWVAELIGGL